MKKSLLSLIPVGIATSVFFSLGSNTALAQEKAKSEEPTISYALKMEITFTGTLYSSTDGKTWTEVEGATSPYLVSLEDAKKMLFCSKEEEPPAKPLTPGENGTVPLSDTVSLDMIWINPGTFMMGSPEDEPFRRDNETQHEVTLTKGYWLGKYELTNEQYTAITQKDPPWKDADTIIGNQAVVYINKREALSICAKLNEIERAAGRLPEGYEYTLPTEAQWEYACRAGTTTGLNSGKNLSHEYVCPEMDEVGWYDGNTEFVHPVGQKAPNAWGLYDMHGNVSEWCLDWYGEYPKTPVVDPIGPEEGVEGVLRGKLSLAFTCRSAYRFFASPGLMGGDSGLRVALVPIQ